MLYNERMNRKLLPLLCLLSLLLPSCIMQMQNSKNIRECSHSYEAYILTQTDKNYLYRKDGVWYLGAYKGKLRKKYDLYGMYDTLERDGTWVIDSLDRSTMYYHALTDKAAEKLLALYGPTLKYVFHDKEQQPGSWLTGLKYDSKKPITLCGERLFDKRSADACFIQRKTSASALLTYPASGIVFVAVDLPGSIAPSIIAPIACLYSLVFMPW